jgi:formylglycine-generating enzyme required for sulfatase activity
MTGHERLVGPETRPPGEPPDGAMVWVPGRQFLMGSDRHYPEEAPVHRALVGGFWVPSKRLWPV